MRGRRTVFGGALAVAVVAWATAGGLTAAAAGSTVPVHPTGTSAFQLDPDVASDGTTSFVVWTERGATTGWDIVGARVGPDGTVLDPQPIAVAASESDQIWAQVAWDGQQHLVVFVEQSAPGFRVRGLRVSPTGEVAGETFTIAELATLTRPRVVGLAGAFYVAWSEAPAADSGDYQVFGTRVDGDGTVAQPDGEQLTTGPRPHNADALAASPEQVLVLISDDTGTALGRRLSLDGTPLDAEPFLIQADTNQLLVGRAIAWNGTDYVVFWGAHRPGTPDRDIYAVRVTPGGVVRDAEAKIVAGSPGTDAPIDAVGIGGVVAVAWIRGDGNVRDVYFSRVASDLRALDPSGVPVATSDREEDRPAITRGPGVDIDVVYMRDAGPTPGQVFRVELHRQAK